MLAALSSNVFCKMFRLPTSGALGYEDFLGFAIWQETSRNRFPLYGTLTVRAAITGRRFAPWNTYRNTLRCPLC